MTRSRWGRPLRELEGRGHPYFFFLPRIRSVMALLSALGVRTSVNGDSLSSISVRSYDAKTLPRTLVLPACQRGDVCPVRPCGAGRTARRAPSRAKVSRRQDDDRSSSDMSSAASRAI